jgi:hypothetical protein
MAARPAEIDKDASPGRQGRRAARNASMTTPDWSEPKATALLVLDDGTVIEGGGLGALGQAAGEVCFNTAMTGYEEILTDRSSPSPSPTSAMSAPTRRTSRR